MHIEDIKKLLPQRYPFLLVDRVVEVDLQKQSIVGYKNVSANENFFNGHFPGQPIMPGVLIIEAMAQAAGILGFSIEGKKEGDLYLFAGADKVKFRQPVVPGDCLELKAQLLTKKRHISKFACQALVNGKLACSAEVTCAKKEI
ncbi:MAG: 3-hydroxyacyl-ACP dehydratase FabZ [Endozoicomonadaceae bacterium]|nr:3-hydroxyacyl-ACP dehydratase FabZ [Endozoicomonadaceae bacterium]MCY4329422.1 3-hydroxyacyl-ACP dehydratase FabZ [Endozoicomonadaceae bacterium]